MASVMRFDEWQDSNGVTVYNGANGAIQSKVLQVVTATDTVNRSTTSGSFVSAGISAEITPLSATSTLIVEWNFASKISGTVTNNNTTGEYSIYDGTTDQSGRQIDVWANRSAEFLSVAAPAHIRYVGTHSNTATTFTGRFRVTSGSRPIQVNNESTGIGVLTITEMEI